jgi:hypothetical protein
MTNKIKTYLDFVPLIILFISAVFLIWAVSTSAILLTWEHYLGLTFLTIAVVLFFVRHLYGVLFVGLTLIVGLIGLLSYSPEITTFYFGIGIKEKQVTILRFQPIFLLWLIIYFVISGRHLVGIASRKYWVEVRNNER